MFSTFDNLLSTTPRSNSKAFGNVHQWVQRFTPDFFVCSVVYYRNWLHIHFLISSSSLRECSGNMCMFSAWVYAQAHEHVPMLGKTIGATLHILLGWNETIRHLEMYALMESPYRRCSNLWHLILHQLYRGRPYWYAFPSYKKTMWVSPGEVRHRYQGRPWESPKAFR